MNLIVAPLSAIVIGVLVRSRFHAVVLYLVIEALFFCFQTLMVLLAWMSGETGFGGTAGMGAFGPAPQGLPLHFVESEVFAYGLVNLAIILVGMVITMVVSTIAARRRTARNSIQLA